MSDYSPPYTEEDQKRDDQRDLAIKRIKIMPLENLTFGDLLDLMEVFYGPWYSHDIHPHKVGVINKILSTHRLDHHCAR
jgi:hypothetical protein